MNEGVAQGNVPEGAVVTLNVGERVVALNSGASRTRSLMEVGVASCRLQIVPFRRRWYSPGGVWTEDSVSWCLVGVEN